MEGIDLNIPTIKKLLFYEVYAFGKSQKIISQGLQEQADKLSQKLYIDLVGPITLVGISNVR